VNRGDSVVVATKGADTSKPRPVLVVQANQVNEAHASVTVCPISSQPVDAPLFRLTRPPGTRTGLERASQVMVDKVVSVPRGAVGRTIGRCDSNELEAVDDALRGWLGL
jgi:mRNA interferase MazF